MKRNHLSVIAIVFTLLAGTSHSRAQASAFTYQGRLTENGSPASGLYDLRFTIFNLVSGGSAVAGPQTNSAVAVSNGVFTVMLDFGSAPFDGSARWLEIGVRPNGSAGAYQTLSPRQPLTATPYAVRAASFDGQVAASQITGTISSNNIGAGSITTVMLAAGAINSNQLAAGAVGADQLAAGAVTAGKIATVLSVRQLGVFSDPGSSGEFGFSVAGVANTGKVLIGAPTTDDTAGLNVGAAYLFSADGTLTTTFTNPTPESWDLFGWSVAAMGMNQVLIGTPGDGIWRGTNSGAAHLFSTSGALITTFTNPTPASTRSFGYSVAALGSERVVIGAPSETVDPDGGAVYLFSTSGELIATFTNPSPDRSARFGWSVAAVGSEGVLLGAPHYDGSDGAAYLFSTNGTLITTFTNPNPGGVNLSITQGDLFGYSVAAVGVNQVLIGAPGDDVGGRTNSGAAHLFSTNGALITTFTNLSPGRDFGYSLAAMSDRVLIGTRSGNPAPFSAHAVHLFRTNGALVTLFPSLFDNSVGGPIFHGLNGGSVSFGSASTFEGRYRVLIGKVGGSGGGGVTLFETEDFAPGLIADGVNANSITTASLMEGAVTAAKISGVLSASQIPDLDAVKIASGTFNTAQIPGLDASKVTGGTLDDARLSANVALRAGGNAFSGTQTITDGNIGIGTSIPGFPLEVVASQSVGRFVTKDNANGAVIVLQNNTPSPVNLGAINFNNSTGTPGQIIYLATSNLTFRVNSAERMRIDPSGDVGIGTINPTNKLHVNGTLRAEGNATLAANLTVGGFPIITQSTMVPTDGSTLAPTTGYVVLNPTNNVTLSFINNGSTAGQFLILQGNGTNTVTVPDSGTANTRLSGDAILGNNDVLTLLWNGSDWVQVSFSNN